MNAKSITASWQRVAVDRRRPVTIASPSPVVDLGLGEPLGVRPQVEEVERVGRAQVGVLLRERARVGELLDPLARPHGEVVPALRADAKVLRELVVAVVRAAARARVRDGFAAVAGSSGRLLSCSIETSILPGDDMRRTS